MQIQMRINEASVEPETLFVAGAFLGGVALRALSFEDLLAGFRVASRCFAERRHSNDSVIALSLCCCFFLCNRLTNLKQYVAISEYKIKIKKSMGREVWRDSWRSDQLMWNEVYDLMDFNSQIFIITKFKFQFLFKF